MATAAATEKKPNPNAPKPKQNLLMIGGVLMLLGAVWFSWEGFLRPLTDDEIKEAKEQKIIDAEKARDAAKDAALEAAREARKRANNH
jgi:hypothetical protein